MYRTPLHLRPPAERQAIKKCNPVLWLEFQAWCCSQQGPALPASPEIVGRYVAEMAEVEYPLIIARLAAIQL